MVWRYGQMQPTSWDDALDLVARVTVAVIKDRGEDGLFVSAFDHGGAGGGYENTWGTGKLYFGAMKVKNIRIHNRPAYNSEVHATRDMGIGELNNCYEDAELADTIVAVGTNALETQTNYFLNHWVPNLRGTQSTRRRQSSDEPIEQARVVIVDPRRTVTVNACEVEAGKDRVMHLAINSGTDLALFNAWLTYIAEKGWLDKAFIAASTNDFDKVLAANKTSLEDAANITGLTADQIRKSAEWIAQPKAGKARRRTMFAYEKGLIWGNDNYRTNGALVNVALATGNIGRPGGGCVRMGGHQEGYSRPSDAHVGRPAAYVDKLLIEGKGGVHHIWACDHYKTTLNALKFKQVYKKRTDLVKDAMMPRRTATATPWSSHRGCDQEGRTIRGRRRHRADQDRPGLPCVAAGRDLGRDEPHLDERRAAHAAHREVHGPARPSHARLPDRSAHCQPHGAGAARDGRGVSMPTSSRALTGRPKKMPSWTATPTTRRVASS